MKIIAFANDTKGMAIRFLSQEIRLMKPGCSIIVVDKVTKDNLPKADYLFVKDSICLAFIGNGRIFHLQTDGSDMRAYHAEIMSLLPEILS